MRRMLMDVQQFGGVAKAEYPIFGLVLLAYAH